MERIVEWIKFRDIVMPYLRTSKPGHAYLAKAFLYALYTREKPLTYEDLLARPSVSGSPSPSGARIIPYLKGGDWMGRNKKELLTEVLDVIAILALAVGVIATFKIPSDIAVTIPANVLILLAFASLILLDKFHMSILQLEHTLSRLEKNAESNDTDDTSSKNQKTHRRVVW